MYVYMYIKATCNASQTSNPLGRSFSFNRIFIRRSINRRKERAAPRWIGHILFFLSLEPIPRLNTFRDISKQLDLIGVTLSPCIIAV